MTKRKNVIDWIVQNRIVSHFIFWFLLFISLPILAALNDGNVKKTVIFSSLTYLPAQLLASYLLVYYQVPKLLFKKKYIKFVLSFLISAYIFLVISKLFYEYLSEVFSTEDLEERTLTQVLTEVLKSPFLLAIVYFPKVYVFVFLMFMTKAFKDRFEERHQLEVLQKEKTNTELKFLKAQTNPHFLFNTLNNLYSLTLEQSEKAPEVVLKLSGMLDYMLYQCKDPEVLIKKEIELIQDYIDLESLRYGDKLTLNFTHHLHDPNVMVAPLILISFVENAFKHGASTNLKNSLIDIELTTNQDQLCFKVFNTLPAKKQSTVDNTPHSGIGFFNSQRQLELNYKNNYDLKSNKTDNDFQVSLTINLK